MLFSFINNLVTSGKQMKMAKAINPINPEYKESQYAKDSLGLWQQLYGGRMAGATAATDNIFTSQANTANTIGKNATSTDQVLSMAGGVQGQTNASLVDLATKEAQDKMARAQGLDGANRLMIGEQDKVFQDKMRKFQLDYDTKQALIGSSLQNKANAFGALDKGLMTAASMFLGPGAGLFTKTVGGTDGGTASGAAGPMLRRDNTPAQLIPGSYAPIKR